MKARGTFTVSVAEGDPQKVSCAHNSLRTSAKASEKVGSRLRYQAAGRTTPTARVIRQSTNKAISENSPSKAGVVHRIAISDHCLCVSNPRCLRASWKVTSSCQRITNQQRIFCGSASRFVHRRAWVLKSPSGSRTKTQRTGTAGNPVEYHPAVAETISTVRSALPYQLAIVVGSQTVLGSDTNASTSKSKKMRLTFRLDQLARLKTRW